MNAAMGAKTIAGYRSRMKTKKRTCMEVGQLGHSKGANHLPPYQAVQIEIRLREKSPENGSFCEFGRRLSGISRQSCHFSEFGDPFKTRENAVFCRLFAPNGQTILG